MKIGCNLLLWTGNFTHDQVNLIDRIAKLGFDGAELPLFNSDGLETSDIKRALDNNGLSCAISTVMPPGGSLIDIDPANRQHGVDHLMRLVDIAHELSCKVICGPMYSPVGHLVGRGRIEVEWKHAVTAFKIVTEHAHYADIRLAVEPLNRFETYFLNLADDVVHLADEVDSDLLGLHYNTFHANIEEKDPVQAIRRSGQKLFHFHCSENDRGVCGSGHIPWKKSFAALQEIGYDGWLSVESFVPVIEEIAASASVWREPASSADVLAKESLDFIRSTWSE